LSVADIANSLPQVNRSSMNVCASSEIIKGGFNNLNNQNIKSQENFEK